MRVTYEPMAGTVVIIGSGAMVMFGIGEMGIIAKWDTDGQRVKTFSSCSVKDLPYLGGTNAETVIIFTRFPSITVDDSTVRRKAGS